MAIRVAIRHETLYRFDRLVQVNPHVVRLRPAPHCRTPIKAYSLQVAPETHFVNWQQDPFANYLARYVFPEKMREMRFSVELVAEMTVINPLDFFLEESAQLAPFSYEEHLARDLGPYLAVHEQGEHLLDWLRGVDRKSQPTVDFLVGLNARLNRDIEYSIRMEAGVQSCEQTLTRRIGSCRDSAWLLVQILRHLGIAARFVSGYLVQLRADVKALDGPSGTQEDFTDLHAWTEAFIPGAGWVGLDPTSGLFAAEDHIPLACTPDPGSAAPINGSTGPCEVSFSFSNQVTRIHEDPRVTKPYTEAQWQTVLDLGDRVDEALQRADVRLTQGGEPTFVSIDDMEGDEWNDAALGEDKLALSHTLLGRLKERFAPGGLIHFGQGKWYPGEPLPRWALSVFWRHDRQALWRDASLLATWQGEGSCRTEAASEFIVTLAARLGIGPDAVIAAYEDDLHTLCQEGRLPHNLDPHEIELSEVGERARLREVLQQGLRAPTGFVLPLCYQDDSNDGYWRSSKWPLRRPRLYLLPGSSPLGLRLPLESLPWQAEAEREIETTRDPFEVRDALADPAEEAQLTRETPTCQDRERDGKEIVHTALCCEVRAGHLYVFLPPLKKLEHWVELIEQVEAAAAELGRELILEGYEPPRDARLDKLQITPDPGVIEVNVQPASNWRELVSNNEILYEQARQARLGTEKFMLDGRHTGTGGGNHVTLGGATPADSPFLRRPELLRSLISFWQNHPSLSYLFSGLFIGPTSQAPRVDEARDDNLYELEIAFAQLPEGETAKPWLVDRVLRNFLVDLTGNTHRAEFCIDKLYSPDSPTGRLGLVEFRNFEMPPHTRMAAVQMLLLRTLVSHFWSNPYRRALLRWGTELHDRFMLPHYVWQDLGEVVQQIRQAGYALDLDWFAPFQFFRFPIYGDVQLGDINLELRGAIEPWHVLGEESSTQGTSRYVDSSVERLQVKLRGMSGERYVATCNGRRIPLRATGVRGEYVAGVRYKAWAPPSALHPTIEVATPLVFDVVDSRNHQSLGGCTYHVTHPGGRSYDTFPVNANEAEARRQARFWSHGHTQGEMTVTDAPPHPDHPYTLDLRYP